MPLKIGGGNRLQYYDEATGQYDDELKSNLNENDKKNLVMFYYFSLDYDSIKFHFPNYLIHDTEYCEIFCRAIRNEVFINEFQFEKCIYLLTYNKKRDKSKFLNSLGYNIENSKKLYDDIIKGTDFDSLSFSVIDNWGLKVKTKTILNNKIVTSIWMVSDGFKLRFITLIPGGDKKWEK